MQRGQFLADLWLAADHPLLQGEGRGEDGFVPWLFNTHPHLNPPLEGEENRIAFVRATVLEEITYNAQT